MTREQFMACAAALYEYRYTANVADVAVNIGFADCDVKSAEFVVEYGFKQYIADGAAVNKEFTDKARKGQKKTDDEIATEKREGVEERVANLQTGEFTRRGPAAAKMTPEEKHRYEIVMTKLDDWAKATGKTLPTKTGKLANPELLLALQSKMYETNKDEIDAEVKRRMKAAAKVIDTTALDALLG